MVNCTVTVATRFFLRSLVCSTYLVFRVVVVVVVVIVAVAVAVSTTILLVYVHTFLVPPSLWCCFVRGWCSIKHCRGHATGTYGSAVAAEYFRAIDVAMEGEFGAFARQVFVFDERAPGISCRIVGEVMGFVCGTGIFWTVIRGENVFSQNWR